MRKIMLVLCFSFVMLLLVACSEVEVEVIEKEYNILSMEFKEVYGIFEYISKYYVKTEEETLVLYGASTDFVKTDKPEFTIKIKETYYKGRSQPHEIISKIYVPKEKISEVSSLYTEKFDETMPFSKK